MATESTTRTLYAQLAPALDLVDRWPTPEPREPYYLMLTDAQYRRVWAFLWRHGSTLPEPVTDPDELAWLRARIKE